MTALTIVADENIPQVKDYFSPLGTVTTVNGRQIKNADLKAADILLVRSVTPVNEALLEGTSIRFVATATIGIDHLDTEYLDNNNIGWTNAPGCNADSVVEYIISACCRLDGVLEMLQAQTKVGIVGMGNVGSRLYQRLDQLGINCIGYDPLIAQDSYPILTTLEEVLSCDVVCLHAPLTTVGSHPTYHLLGEEQLMALKMGAVLISAGRGAVVDNQALQRVLKRRGDLCVVLDVWEDEPAIDIELLKRIDLASPHIAGYSFDGKLAGTRMIYEACAQYLNSKVTAKPIDPVLIELQLKEKNIVIKAVKEAVLTSYDVAEDDQLIRGALLHCDATERPLAFDKLRKNYRQRREFSRYRIANADEMSESVINTLLNLGFSH
jgi:erythronate-4-phosphate dehydrogenase